MPSYLNQVDHEFPDAGCVESSIFACSILHDDLEVFWSIAVVAMVNEKVVTLSVHVVSETIECGDMGVTEHFA